MPTPVRPEQNNESDQESQLGLFAAPAAAPVAAPGTEQLRNRTLGELFDQRQRARPQSASPRTEVQVESYSPASDSEREPKPTKPAPDLRALQRRLLSPRTTRRDRSESTLPAWHREPSSAREAEPDLRPSRVAHPDASLIDLSLVQSAEPVPETRRIWTVADLVGSVRSHIEQAWADLWVHGEISNLRTAPSGHLYFTLKDGESQLPAVLFRRQAQLLRFAPEDGLEVLLRGKVSVYEQRGQMQLIAEHLEPVGAGSLQIAFEQLKARLAAEGLFAADRKRSLPPYPHCVGIITSPSGAVIRDFLNVAGRRHAALDILLYPAVVQGLSAASEIAAGIAYFNQTQSVDVIVIARGGGSLEDLAPFNTELLARAIAHSKLPIVSAIGHETDVTIADFVADLRAPTPSAAAELITSAQHRVSEQVSELGHRLGRASRYQLMLARQRLNASSMHAVHARLREGFNRREQRVDTLRFRLDSAIRTQLQARRTQLARHSVESALVRLRSRLAERTRVVDALHYRSQNGCTQTLRALAERLQAATARLERQDPTRQLQVARNTWESLDTRLLRMASDHLQVLAHRSQSLATQLQSLSPLAVLSRGYALVFHADGALVKRAADVQAHELLTLQLAEGTVRSRVEQPTPAAPSTSSGEA